MKDSVKCVVDALRAEIPDLAVEATDYGHTVGVCNLATRRALYVARVYRGETDEDGSSLGEVDYVEQPIESVPEMTAYLRGET